MQKHSDYSFFSSAKCIVSVLFVFLMMQSVLVFAQPGQPAAPVPAGGSRCGAGEVSLSASGCDGGLLNWYDAPVAGNLVHSGAVFSPVVTTTTQFYVSCTKNGSESLRSVVTAEVQPVPLSPQGTQITGCGPGDVNVSVQGCSGGNYNWYKFLYDSNGFLLDSLLYTGPVYSTHLQNTGTTLLVTCTQNGCESVPALVMVQFSLIPAAPVTTGASRCGPGQVTLSAFNPGTLYGEYKWYSQASGGSPVHSAGFTHPQFNSYSPVVSATTSFWVSFTSDDGCETPRSEVVATVESSPPPVTTGDTRSTAGNFNLSATGCAGGDFVWYNAPSGGNMVHTGSSFSPFLNQSQSYWVACRINNCEGARTEVKATLSGCDPNEFSVTIPDAYALPHGVAANTVYPGYGPATLISLTALPAGGTPPYQYSWNTNTTTQSISVSTASTQTYTVALTDANGCTATASAVVHVTNVGCGNNGEKVLVCKLPPGNASSPNSICVSREAVAQHLSKGSYLGQCNSAANTVTGLKKKQTSSDSSTEHFLSVTPNPSWNSFTLNIRSVDRKRGTVTVFDANGRRVEQVNVWPGDAVRFGSSYAPGMYFIEWLQGNEKQHLRAVKL